MKHKQLEELEFHIFQFSQALNFVYQALKETPRILRKKTKTLTFI